MQSMQQPPDKRIKMVIMQFFVLFSELLLLSNYRPGKNSDLGLWPKHLSKPGVGTLQLLGQISPATHFYKCTLGHGHTHLFCITCGCFHATAAKLGSSDRDHMAKPISLSGVLQKKSADL